MADPGGGTKISLELKLLLPPFREDFCYRISPLGVRPDPSVSHTPLVAAGICPLSEAKTDIKDAPANVRFWG